MPTGKNRIIDPKIWTIYNHRKWSTCVNHSSEKATVSNKNDGTWDRSNAIRVDCFFLSFLSISFKEDRYFAMQIYRNWPQQINYLSTSIWKWNHDRRNRQKSISHLLRKTRYSVQRSTADLQSSDKAEVEEACVWTQSTEAQWASRDQATNFRHRVSLCITWQRHEQNRTPHLTHV